MRLYTHILYAAEGGGAEPFQERWWWCWGGCHLIFVLENYLYKHAIMSAHLHVMNAAAASGGSRNASLVI